MFPICWKVIIDRDLFYFNLFFRLLRNIKACIVHYYSFQLFTVIKLRNYNLIISRISFDVHFQPIELVAQTTELPQIAHEVLRIFLQCSAIFDTVAYSQNVLRTFWGFLELLNILGTFQKLQIAILYFQKFTTFMHLFVPPPSRWSIIKYQHHRLLLPPLHCGHRDAPIDYVTTEFRWRQVACCVCVCVCRQVRQVAVALWQRRGQWKEENLVSIKILLKSIYFCFRHYECGN